MKIKLFKVCALFAALCIVLASFAACSQKTADPKEDDIKIEEQKSDGTSSADNNEAKEDAAVTENNQADNNAPAQDNTPKKYGDAEVYQKDDKPYAKTDDGKEVELTDDNLQKLLEAYAKVQGSGSQEEKDILNQIQVFLEAPRN